MTRHNISIKFFRGALQIMCTSQNATSVAKKARGGMSHAKAIISCVNY